MYWVFKLSRPSNLKIWASKIYTLEAVISTLSCSKSRILKERFFLASGKSMEVMIYLLQLFLPIKRDIRKI